MAAHPAPPAERHDPATAVPESGWAAVASDWAADQQAFRQVPWGKAMMWIFLISDTFVFTCFLTGYMAVRISATEPWPNTSLSSAAPTKSGTGTKFLRSALGRPRTSATHLASSKPGTSHCRRSACNCGSKGAGKLAPRSCRLSIKLRRAWDTSCKSSGKSDSES